MNPKPQPNRKRYMDILRKLTPEQRLKKAFELTEFSRKLFLQGLRSRNPDLSETEIKRLYIERLTKCHNKNY